MEFPFPDCCRRRPCGRLRTNRRVPCRRSREPGSPAVPADAAPDGTVPVPPAAATQFDQLIDRDSSFFDPSTAIKLPDVTGSIPAPGPRRAESPPPAR